ncbi:MAG TPA: hypothetical protein PKA58_13965 [Polyangium sp.]|nr:hypothetical protein [Polyangium sp.]
MSSAADFAAKMTELLKEVITTQARFEALDKEMHRLHDITQRTIDKFERNQDDLIRRVTKIEAEVETVYRAAVLDAAKSQLRVVVREEVQRAEVQRANQEQVPLMVPSVQTSEQ